MFTLRRKPQEENLPKFCNQIGFPLKFTQLPIHRWLWSSLHPAVTLLAGNGKNRETPFKSRGVYGGSPLKRLFMISRTDNSQLPGYTWC